MIQTIVVILAVVIAYIIGIFTTKKTASEDAKVIDLTTRIKDNILKAQSAQKTSDQAVKDYQDALKVYDPTFHSDDDDSGGSA